MSSFMRRHFKWYERICKCFGLLNLSSSRTSESEEEVFSWNKFYLIYSGCLHVSVCLHRDRLYLPALALCVLARPGFHNEPVLTHLRLRRFKDSTERNTHVRESERLAKTLLQIVRIRAASPVHCPQEWSQGDTCLLFYSFSAVGSICCEHLHQ
ncbi:hypothetical protein MRX96_032834 [Rhipicephalus microplus]